jgi:cysteinyl-tRNA synthetase
LQSGARIAIGEKKENPLDFALWKAAKEGEPYWDSPWGKGRPGWHIECSAMNKRFLGDTIDIHCGGQDLIFPHHENEIAQSECANGCTFSKYWMHNGYINVDNVKMSKSLGNFKTVREIANVYGYEVIRYFLISSHYRSPINYSLEIIEQCKSALERLYTCRESLDFALKNAKDIPDDEELIKKLNSHREQFITAMDDDLNTADGVAAVFELVKDINTSILIKKYQKMFAKQPLLFLMNYVMFSAFFTIEKTTMLIQTLKHLLKNASRQEQIRTGQQQTEFVMNSKQKVLS